MTKSRWFRVLICLLMVCCLIFHMSPIKAEALALEASLAIGLVGALILASAGVVFVLETTNQIQAIGQSFQNYMTQWGTANNKQAEVQDWFFGIQFYDPGDDGDEDDDDWVSPTNRKVNLARGILAGISAWCASIILGNINVEEDVESAPAGYMYYGSMCLEDVSSLVDMSVYPYVTIGYNDTSQFEYCLFSSEPLVVTNQWSFYGYYWGLEAVSETDALLYYNYTPPSHDWHLEEEKLDLAAGDRVWNINAHIEGNNLVKHELWTNYDLYGTENFNFGELLIPAGVASSVKTAPVLPATYVGDIPQQIQDGELEPGGIELPDINYDPLIQPGVSLQDSTIGTLYKLSTGELSYENFLQQIKVDGSSTDPIDPTPQPSEPSQDEDKWEPPTNPGKFALDLKEFFPFCIPFDLYDFFSCLNADPVAPVIDWAIPLPGGSSYPITIDLSIFDPVAKILRTMELLLFCVGLAFKTRDLIRG